jgi:hypothetical protein
LNPFFLARLRNFLGVIGVSAASAAQASASSLVEKALGPIYFLALETNMLA